MAVARQRRTAAKMPNHMPCAAIGWPYADWMKKVSHRNAPGAISAIALTVNPVRPRVDGGFTAGDSGDIRPSFCRPLFFQGTRAVNINVVKALGGDKNVCGETRPS